MVTPTFAGIAATYSIQDVKLVGDGVSGGGQQLLQLIDAEGCVQDEDNFGWFLADEIDTAEGWYNNMTYEFAERTIDPGEGMLMSNFSGDYGIQFAGQVNYTAIPAYECEGNGFCAVGNMTPVAKNIQLFTLTGDGVSGGGQQLLQIIDAEGCVQDEDNFGWFLADEIDTAEGWYNNMTYEFAARDIQPGEGLLMSNFSGDYTINIPGTGDELPQE